MEYDRWKECGGTYGKVARIGAEDVHGVVELAQETLSVVACPGTVHQR